MIFLEFTYILRMNLLKYGYNNSVARVGRFRLKYFRKEEFSV